MNQILINRIKLFAIVTLAVLILITSIRGCSRLAKVTNYAAQIERENGQLKTKRLADSSTIASFRVAMAESEREIDRLRYLASKAEVKRPVAAVSASVRVVVHDTVFIDSPVLIDSIPHLTLPAPIQKHTRYYAFSGNLTEHGYLSIDTFAVNAELTWAIGDTVRAGFFNRLLRKRDKVVRMHIDNPLIEVKGLDAVIVPNKPKRFRYFLGGLGVGILAGKVF